MYEASDYVIDSIAHSTRVAPRLGVNIIVSFLPPSDVAYSNKRYGRFKHANVHVKQVA